MRENIYVFWWRKKDRLSYSSLLAFLILWSQICFSQLSTDQYSFQTLNVNDGLSQNSVISIAQDSIGYLWFATQDGLNRYDGRGFKYYDKHFEDVTRPNYSRLGKIIKDKENNLWIITLSGRLEKYFPESDTFKEITGINNVSNLYQDNHLNLYISTYDSGLFKIGNNIKDTLNVLTLDQTGSIYALAEFGGEIVLATAQGLIKFNPYSEQRLKKYSTEFSFGSIAYSKSNTLFIGSYGDGVYYFDEIEDQLIPFRGLNEFRLPKNLNVQDLLFDNKGRLWVATYGNGVYMLNFEKQLIEHFVPDKYNNQSISYKDVLNLYEDFNGTLWLGTDGGGVSYYDEHLFKFKVLTDKQVPQDVKVNVIRSISQDNQGNLWLGTSGEGLTRVNLQEKNYKTFTEDNSSLASNRIMSLAFIDGELWIGHQGEGLQIMSEDGRFKEFNISSTPTLNANTIWRIYKDNEERIWLATRNNGLIQFDKSKGVITGFTQKSTPKALISNNIRTVIEGPKNVLFAGADDGGITKIDLNTDELSKLPNLDFKIKSLYIDNGDKETLWIGTNGNGLIKYNLLDNTYSSYSTENGLVNNVVYGILPDDGGNLWLSSNRGLSKLDISTSEIINFTNYDGLQASEFNTGAYFKCDGNTLYFGGLEGLNWFNPDELSFNTSEPKTVISKFEVFNKERDLAQDLELNYNDNTVTFTFAGLHFSQPDRNHYQYKLENHDDKWTYAENSNTAHYTNLPPGDYTFKVKSSNYDGVWNNDPATFDFTVEQPWFLSTTAIVIYVLFFVLGVYFIVDYYKWKWQMKMQLKYEHAEAERLKKLNAFKTKLYTNISHEFRTPLTLISGPIEQQLEKEHLDETDKKALSLVKKNSDRLLKLVDQLLDLSKLESGNLNLSIKKGDLGLLLNQLGETFRFMAKEKQIAFEETIEDMDDVWFDRDVIEKVVTNLLSNAVKYTPTGGYIKYHASLKDGQLILAFLNNGNDLSGEDLSKLFKRYFQRNRDAEGAGIGLSLVKELVALNHGNIVVSALNEDDIQFTVTLPVEKSYFTSSEIIEENTVPVEMTKENNAEGIQYINGDRPVLQIIEDDEDLRAYIVSIFKNEYKIVQAADGEDGIKQALEHIPDIIVSDVMMPKVDGIELCETLKKDHRTNHIPIILLTAKSGEKNEMRGIEMGADAYITKPFNHNRLKLRVNKLIELRRALQKHYRGELPSMEVGELNSGDKEFIGNLESTVKENMNDPEFNSESLSDKLLMSRMQLHRKLKAILGTSTSNYIRDARLKQASELLKSNNLSVSEIAYEVGFNTPSYFIRTFKKAYKLTPKEYHSKYNNS